jgi:hypothetical protein
MLVHVQEIEDYGATLSMYEHELLILRQEGDMSKV